MGTLDFILSIIELPRLFFGVVVKVFILLSYQIFYPYQHKI